MEDVTKAQAYATRRQAEAALASLNYLIRASTLSFDHATLRNARTVVPTIIDRSLAVEYSDVQPPYGHGIMSDLRGETGE